MGQSDRDFVENANPNAAIPQALALMNSDLVSTKGVLSPFSPLMRDFLRRTGLAGALIFLQKLRISPDAAFSVNDWTAFVIFITVIGGVGRIEGPFIGVVVFFVLRQTLADLGAIYLIMLGVVAIVMGAAGRCAAEFIPGT